MSDKSSELLTRLKRLHEFAGLFHQEMGAIIQLMESDPKEPQTHLPGSTSEEEMRIMAEQVAALADTVPRPSKERDALLALFSGPSSLLVKHMAPSVIHGGRGFVRSTDTLQMYEESLTDSPAATVVGWPTGFYRNSVTKDTQFLLRIGSEALCFDGLPGNNTTLVYLKLIHESAYTQVAVELLTDDELQKLANHVERMFSELVDTHKLDQ